MSDNESRELMQLVEEAFKRWGSTTVSIFVEADRSRHAADGYGSGYVCLYGKNRFLVTAGHVVDGLKKYKIKGANINEFSVSLNGLRFLSFPDHDIAIAELNDEWLINAGVKSLRASQLGKLWPGWTRSGIFVVAGYPSKQNKLDARYGRVDRRCQSITVRRLPANTVKTDVKNALLFYYNNKRVFDSAGLKLGQQSDLHGMSGGPCWELMLSNDPNPIASFDLLGVLVEWHEKENVIVVSPWEELVSLFDSIVN